MTDFRARAPGATYMPAIWILVGIMAALELMFQITDAMGRGYLRFIAQQMLGVRPDLAWSLTGDFPLQPFVVFFSHAFLHGGLVHLAMNATVLLAVGSVVVTVTGQRSAVILFLLCAVAGGALFAVLNAGQTLYLVGASGGVFGYLAAWKRWELQVLKHRKLPVDKVRTFLLALLAVNVALMFVYPNVSWEAHLGGFAAGWLIAPRLRRRHLGYRE
ncbi:MAG: rhomboid family intramembrane serine protease [Pseudomonadota bacterium]